MDLQTLTSTTVADLVTGYQNRELSPVEVMQLTLAQLEAVNPAINAVYAVDQKHCISQAKAAEKRYRDGQPAGPLDGVPVTVKDSVHATGTYWHHGAAAHGAGRLATKDAPPAEKLRAASAIILGKCTMPDFGLSASGVSSYHGIIRNPWGLDWSTGGSSAGSGASLAAGIGMMSVGSDIAGSVRLPASHCGLAALKPTQGMIAHTPASDVRSAGPMCRHASDLEGLLNILGGVHRDDRFSVPVAPLPDNDSLTNCRVKVIADFNFGPEVEEPVLKILKTAKRCLAGIVSDVVAAPGTYTFDAYLPIDDSLKLRGWQEYINADVHLRERTPERLVDWFKECRYWDQTRISAIEAGITRGISQTNALFDHADFLLTPVMPVVNFPAEHLGVDQTMPLRHATFTAMFNQSGHPAVVIRAGFDDRSLPVGIQLVAKRFDDIRLVRLATALAEQLAGQCSDTLTSWPLSPRENTLTGRTTP